MAQSAGHFKNFEAHTRLKHAILRAYVERWSRILLGGPGPSRQLVRVVDACAGEGQDEQGNPGSPLIAIREAEKARGQMSERRASPAEIQIVAIENDPVRFKHLAKVVSAFGGRHLAKQGTLADYIAELEPDFSSTPTLFFIDPFGMEPLRADVVRRALHGPKNEVLLLFADQAGLRHLGAADAIDEEDDDEVELDLFGDRPVPVPAPRRKEVLLTGEAAVRILTAAFGDDRWRAIQDLPRQKRRQALVDMYADLLRSMGAKYVLPLPIIGSQTKLKYHLMFATKSGKGYEVMKDSIERALKTDLLDQRSAQLMRLGVAAPTAAVEQAIRKHFAGRQASWTGRAADDSVKVFALQQTPAMPHQMEDLKQRLKPLRVRGEQALVYDFRRTA